MQTSIFRGRRPILPAPLVAAPDADGLCPHPGGLGDRGCHLAPDRVRGALGFQEPVLSHPALSRHGACQRRAPALEPLPFRRPSLRCGSAIPAVHPHHAAVRLARPRAVDAGFRRGRLRPFPARRAGLHTPVPPAGLASGGRGRRRPRLHARRVRYGPASAHGHDLQLRLLPARLLAAGRGHGPPLLSLRRAVRARAPR